MNDAKAVANVFYKLARAEDENLTNMQIQKLAYIAHGFSLGVLGKALIADEIEAWEYGPVIPALYHEYKGYGAKAVKNRLSTSTKPIEVGSPDYMAIQTVFITYGRLSGPQLSALTHKPGTPWHQVWEPEKRRKPIPNSLIEAHYRSFPNPELPIEEGVEDLEYAASLDDTQTFVGLLQETKWENRTVDEIARVIQLALNLSAPTAAEFLYNKGLRLHPDTEAFATFARLFAPQKRASSTSEANPTLRANREWLKANREKYRGQWIALRDGHLLGIAPSLEDLRRTLTDTTNTLLTRA